MAIDAHRLEGPFENNGGHNWSASVPAPLAGVPGNTPERPHRSRLAILEDGVELTGGRHAYFADMSGAGAGRYNHIGQTVFFASSDNSDPNTNGRSYTLVAKPSAPRLLTLGTCHVGNLILAAANRGQAETVLHDQLTYNPLDTLQFVETRLGRRKRPASLADFTAGGASGVDPSWSEEADGMVLEISSRTFVECDGEALMPPTIASLIGPLFSEPDDPLKDTAVTWYREGLMRNREELRVETAALLLERLNRTHPSDGAELRIVRDARSRLLNDDEMSEGVEKTVRSIDRPTTLLLHVWQYMPDGRPLRFPRGLKEQLQGIASDLGLSVVDPAAAVEARGAEASLTDDLMYYRPALLDDLFEEIQANLIEQGLVRRDDLNG